MAIDRDGIVASKVEQARQPGCFYALLRRGLLLSAIVASANTTALLNRVGGTVGERRLDDATQDQFVAGIWGEGTATAASPHVEEGNVIPSRDCPRLRGMHGEWHVDLDSARKTSYVQSHRSIMFRRKHGRNEFHPQQQWAWVETKYPECRLHLLTFDGMCRTLQSLNVTRIFMVGDSLQNVMLKSMIGLFKLPMLTSEWTPSKKMIYVDRTISCPSSDFAFDVFFARENPYPHMIDLTPTNETDWRHYGMEDPGCGYLENARPERIRDNTCPWHEAYNASSRRTLLVVNGGAHYHSDRTFTAMMDGFVDTLVRLDRWRDIVMFRNTVPGHKNCFEIGDAPFANYSEYATKAMTTMYDWNKFEGYNEYTRRKSEALLASGRSPVRMRILNVYNMTVLRPDGHASAKDCLHYENPGPIDWWNHLMYSNLVDIAAEEAGARDQRES